MRRCRNALRISRPSRQHDVERLGVDAEECSFPGTFDDHVVPFVFEPFAQGIGDFLFVLNDEDPHGLWKLPNSNPQLPTPKTAVNVGSWTSVSRWALGVDSCLSSRLSVRIEGDG